MRTDSQRSGDAAEQLVADQLTAAGWSILGRNVHVGRFELDLIGVDPGPPPTLVVVEVRWRAGRAFGLPEETVTGRKRLRDPGRGLRPARAGRAARTAPGCRTCPSGSTSWSSSRAIGSGTTVTPCDPVPPALRRRHDTDRAPYHRAMRMSGGILLYRHGHRRVSRCSWRIPGGPYFRDRDEGHWTIPKGEPDPDEALLDAAVARIRGGDRPAAPGGRAARARVDHPEGRQGRPRLGRRGRPRSRRRRTRTRSRSSGRRDPAGCSPSPRSIASPGSTRARRDAGSRTRRSRCSIGWRRRSRPSRQP